FFFFFFFFSSRRRHTRSYGDWSSDVCSSDLSTVSPAATMAERWKAATRRPKRSVARWGGALLADTAIPETAPATTSVISARLNEIGRASCRERVEVSVGAGR